MPTWKSYLCFIPADHSIFRCNAMRSAQTPTTPPPYFPSFACSISYGFSAIGLRSGGGIFGRCSDRFMRFHPIKGRGRDAQSLRHNAPRGLNVPFLIEMAAILVLLFRYPSSLQSHFSEQHCRPIKRHDGSSVCRHVTRKGVSFKRLSNNFRCT